MKMRLENMLDFKCDFGEIDRTYSQLNYYNGNTWLTNFDNEQVPIYKKAISIYGGNELFIVNKGYDCRERLLNDNSSLHTSVDKDLSEFWRIFDGLDKE